MPRPDFPRNLPEFLQRFPSEETCAEYVYRSRWPDVESVTLEELEAAGAILKRAAIEAREQ